MEKTVKFYYDYDSMDVLNLLNLISDELEDFGIDLIICDGDETCEEFIIKKSNKDERD